MLSQVAFQHAKDKSKKIIIFNTILIPAINLYRKLGFIEVPLVGITTKRY